MFGVSDISSTTKQSLANTLHKKFTQNVYSLDLDHWKKQTGRSSFSTQNVRKKQANSRDAKHGSNSATKEKVMQLKGIVHMHSLCKVI